MDHLRIDVSGAPEGGFSLYAAAHLAWTLLIATIVAGTIAGIVYALSEVRNTPSSLSASRLRLGVG